MLLMCVHCVFGNVVFVTNKDVMYLQDAERQQTHQREIYALLMQSGDNVR